MHVQSKEPGNKNTLLLGVCFVTNLHTKQLLHGPDLLAQAQGPPAAAHRIQTQSTEPMLLTPHNSRAGSARSSVFNRPQPMPSLHLRFLTDWRCLPSLMRADTETPPDVLLERKECVHVHEPAASFWKCKTDRSPRSKFLKCKTAMLASFASFASRPARACNFQLL